LTPGTLGDLRVPVAGLKFDGAEPNIQDFTRRVIIASSPLGCQGRAGEGLDRGFPSSSVRKVPGLEELLAGTMPAGEGSFSEVRLEGSEEEPDHHVAARFDSTHRALLTKADAPEELESPAATSKEREEVHKSAVAQDDPVLFGRHPSREAPSACRGAVAGGARNRVPDQGSPRSHPVVHSLPRGFDTGGTPQRTSRSF
jgi:hypothetical protein